MSGQYRTGSASVTNGSAVVTGSSTEWLANVQAGDLFKVKDINTIYEILSVDSDLQITLKIPWAGSTLTYQEYMITVDFTTYHKLTEVWAGDRDWPYHLTNTIRLIDQKLQWLVDRIQSFATTTTTSSTTTTTTTTA